MLVDVVFKVPDVYLSVVLTIVGVGRGPTILPERIGEGMYLSNHWSINQLVTVRERWREDPPVWLDFDEYGVCDTPEQVVEKFKLRERPERFFVSFVKLRRADQPREGGWRWHKWGPYIGDQKPQREYLHDEPDIEEVHTYHIYELPTEGLST